MKSKKTMKDVQRPSPPDEDELIRFIVANVARSHLIEMYYWCREPSLLRILRGVSTIDENTRDELAAFFEGQGEEVRVRGTGGPNDFTLFRGISSPKH